ncbi:hypothetical protein NIES4074_08520 [Cylindrospermum sp. NIES-4074]|nr:hypothetical protein NIES4074_08520 [Cylindrospermum sp. NIES-4074]
MIREQKNNQVVLFGVMQILNKVNKNKNLSTINKEKCTQLLREIKQIGAPCVKDMSIMDFFKALDVTFS